MTFEKIDPKALERNVFSMFDDGWALLTAGTPEKYNTMTISWGGLGWLWRSPVCFTFVRHDRYTYQFVEEQDYFTVSIFSGDKYRQQLTILGSKSGRDMDKMGDSGLTPLWLDGQPAYEEADVVLVCQKLYSTQFDKARLPADVVETCYPGVPAENIHEVYTSRIVAAYHRS